jgi:hypothetical protein
MTPKTKKQKKAGLGRLPSLLTELTYEKPNLIYKHNDVKKVQKK